MLYLKTQQRGKPWNGVVGHHAHSTRSALGLWYYEKLRVGVAVCTRGSRLRACDEREARVIRICASHAPWNKMLGFRVSLGLSETSLRPYYEVLEVFGRQHGKLEGFRRSIACRTHTGCMHMTVQYTSHAQKVQRSLHTVLRGWLGAWVSCSSQHRFCVLG
jgi:hypothetical protein